MENSSFFSFKLNAEKAELENVTPVNEFLSPAPRAPGAGRARRRRAAETNPADDVKTVARLKSMGDGGSSQIGSVMAAVTQRRGRGLLGGGAG